MHRVGHCAAGSFPPAFKGHECSVSCVSASGPTAQTDQRGNSYEHGGYMGGEVVYQSREDKYTANSMIRGTDSKNQHSRHGRIRAYIACAKALRQHSTQYIQGLARKSGMVV